MPLIPERFIALWVRVAIGDQRPQFTNLTRGIVLADLNDANLDPPNSGTALNPILIATSFCNVGTQVFVEPLVTSVTNLGTQTCPSGAPADGLTCSPVLGVPGSTVMLSGTNLVGAIMVLFNGLSGRFTNASGPYADSLITAVVPEH